MSLKVEEEAERLDKQKKKQEDLNGKKNLAHYCWLWKRRGHKLSNVLQMKASKKQGPESYKLKELSSVNKQ